MNNLLSLDTYYFDNTVKSMAAVILLNFIKLLNIYVRDYACICLYTANIQETGKAIKIKGFAQKLSHANNLFHSLKNTVLNKFILQI